MLSKSVIKYINSLKIKKYRQIHNAFIVEGEKCVSELLNGSFEVISIYCLENWKNSNHLLLKGSKAEITIITTEELKKLSELSTPNQVLAVAVIPSEQELKPEDFSDLMLALDGIRDPGNMGTI